ncbi:hypothetical protein BWQ96_08416 [Gracilariopsis chorda]|uniref:HTH psq-type domain-containing protein n=1 Tax=Gracilariopsis chorda TaxID=448386 RepID=A0A2V3IIE1_9FLOR|nr:hypothetical protein BWQ96_08416 [Gracilariopsis chorda]|eukprot:PXF41856.1 hypothetical protein BWQ96_08416 [Gracilariopsis chorda]
MDEINSAINGATPAAAHAARNDQSTEGRALKSSSKPLQNKRKGLIVSDRIEALKLLGFNSISTRSCPLYNPATRSAWTKKDVAAEYGIAQSTLSGWLKHADKIFAADQAGTQAIKRSRIATGDFPAFAKALVSYMNDVILYLTRESPFREGVMKERALQIRDQMVTRLWWQAVNAMKV